jgi:hypothetical protein
MILVDVALLVEREEVVLRRAELDELGHAANPPGLPVRAY